MYRAGQAPAPWREENLPMPEGTRCIVVDDDGNTAMATAQRIGFAPAGGMALIASEVGVRVEYVAVYGNL